MADVLYLRDVDALVDPVRAGGARWALPDIAPG